MADEDLGTIRYSMEIDVSGLVQGEEAMDDATGSAKRMGDGVDKAGRQTSKASKSVKQSAETMDRSFRAVTRTVQLLGAAVGGLTLGRIVTEAATFEQGMRNVAAVSGATAAQLEGLSDSALRAAATTRFNPKQTTEGLYALASSGQDASEQMSSLINVLNLAEAGQADLGTSTELTVSTLNQFGLAASESGRVADVFVASIGASALNVNRLQVAMRNAGPTAAALGQSLEGTTATLGMLTTAFGNGERAGTGFRAILNELPDQAADLGIAVRDANGQFLPMVDILEQLERRGVTSGQAVSMFGAEAGPALAALLRNGSEALLEMEGRLQSNGQAAQVAADQLDTLRGDMDAFASSVSVAMIEIGDSQSGALRSTTQTVTNLVRLWSGYGDTLGDQLDTTQRLSTAIQTTAAAAAGMAAVSIAIRSATVAQIAFNAAARANPYVLIATTIAGATAAVWAFTNAQESALEVWDRAQESEAAYQAAMADQSAANRIQEIVRERAELQERLNDAQSRWIRNGTAEAAIKKELADLEREYHDITDARIKAEKAQGERQKDTDDREKKSKEEQLKLQQKIMEALGGTGSAVDAVASMTSALDEQLMALEKGERAVLAYRLQQEGATSAQKEAALATFDRIQSIKEEQAAQESLEQSIKRLVKQTDPLAEMAETWGIVQSGLAQGLITPAQAERIMDGLVDAGEEAGDEFVNEWQSVADRVADSLQDAIASGDWDKLGDAIGNALAASIAGVVNKTITDSLAKDLTANSSTLAQIGGAFAGPIAGAVAGGAIQLATRELSDFFSLGDWDPTAARQASQGTGTVLGSIDAKSESIAKATDYSATAARELVGINRNMLRALQAVQLGIEGASARVARGAGGASLPGVSAGGLDFDLTGGIMPIFDATLGAAFDFFDGALDVLSLGMFDLGGLLGGKSRKVDDGIQIIGGYIGDLIDETLVSAYATFRVKKNAWSSTKTKEKFQRIEGDVGQQFQLVFESLFDSIVAGADVLGVEAAGRLAGFQTSTQRISLEGLSASEQTAELEAYFGTVFDNMAAHTIPWLEDFQAAGEGLGETLARVATDVSVTEEAVAMLGVKFSELAGRELVEASQRLVELNGGMEQFISGMQNFIGNFATEAQQFEINSRALANGMGELPLPETREGFWQLMQAQDASTAAGAETIATLLRLQGVADQYYSHLEQGAEEAAKAAADLLAMLSSGTDSAMSALRRSVDAQRAAAQEELDARLTANQLATDAARAGLEAIESEVQGLEQALDSLKGAFDPMREVRRAEALATLRNALATGDLTGAGEAAGIAGQIDAAGFATRVDYERAQGQTINLLDQVAAAGGDQLTVAERSLRALEKQATAIQRQYSDEMARLDGILDNAQSQVDALRGINSGVMSIADAISELAFALSMERPSAIRQEYTDAGQAADAQGSAWWEAEIAAGRATIADLEYQLWLQSEGARDFAQWRGVPEFADGGIASGPSSGYPAMLHGREAVIPLSGGAIPLKMSGDKELLAEMRKMREELQAANRALVKSNEKQRELLQRWDQNGLPEERSFA